MDDDIGSLSQKKKKKNKEKKKEKKDIYIVVTLKFSLKKNFYAWISYYSFLQVIGNSFVSLHL